MTMLYVSTYEVVGKGLPLATTFYDEVQSAKMVHWQFVDEVSGKGYRPGHDGGLSSVFFDEIPPAWRRVGADGLYVEARPHKGSKAGKEFARRIAELPRIPRAESLVSELGYSPSEFAIDRQNGRIYFPSEVRILFPSERIFVRLPRFQGDGFEPDPNLLNAIPESEFMRAVEDHNAEARRHKQAQTEGGAA